MSTPATAPAPLPAPAALVGDKIRKFEDRGIQGAIDKALKGLDPGTKGAVVAYTNGGEANLAVVGRIGKRWSVVGVLDKPFKGKLDVGAAVRFTW